MKKFTFKSKKLIVLLVLVNLFGIGVVFGQQKTQTGLPGTEKETILTTEASFQSRNSIRLNEEATLSEFYKADITIFDFKSEEEAILYFDAYTDNLLSYKIDFLSKKVVIHLHLNYAAKNWGKAEWSTYLNEKLQNQ